MTMKTFYPALALALCTLTVWGQTTDVPNSTLGSNVVGLINTNINYLSGTGVSFPASCTLYQRWLLTVASPAIPYVCSTAGTPGTWTAAGFGGSLINWSNTGDFGQGSLALGSGQYQMEFEPGVFQGYMSLYPGQANTNATFLVYPSGSATLASIRSYGTSNTTDNQFLSMSVSGATASLQAAAAGNPSVPITSLQIGGSLFGVVKGFVDTKFIAGGANPRYFVGSFDQHGFSLGDATQTNYPAKETCSSSLPAKFWYSGPTPGVKDSVQICAKDISDVWAWRTLY